LRTGCQGRSRALVRPVVWRRKRQALNSTGTRPGRLAGIATREKSAPRSGGPIHACWPCLASELRCSLSALLPASTRPTVQSRIRPPCGNVLKNGGASDAAVHATLFIVDSDLIPWRQDSPARPIGIAASLRSFRPNLAPTNVSARRGDGRKTPLGSRRRRGRPWCSGSPEISL